MLANKIEVLLLNTFKMIFENSDAINSVEPKIIKSRYTSD